MRKITQTIVGTTPPLDKNVLWLDTTNSDSPVEKVFLNGAWIPTSAAGGEYYTKDEVNENFMGKIDDPHVGNILVMDENGKAVDSTKKTADFIANPEVSGQNGEVLGIDSEGNPIWTTITPTGTTDDHMDDTSTNAVGNRYIKEYVDSNYARKDGYYSQMTVGSAENLVGQTVDSKAYLIRPTGGENNEVANGVASVLGMEGHTEKFNQLCPYQTSQWGGPAGTITIEGATLTLTPATSYVEKYTTKSVVISSHIYYTYVVVVQAFSSGVRLSESDNSNFITITTQPGTYRSIKQATLNTSLKIVAFGSNLQPTIIKDVKFIDLTAIFGAGNEPSTVEEFEAWLAKNVGLKPYYGYNAGSLLSAQTLGIKTYGQNLLNPTTRQAKLIPYEWEENSNVYTIKNVPSGTTATFTPDATGVAESITITDNKFKITNYGSGILELSAATADTYVCMKWDEQKDDDVVPYEEHTQTFDVRKVYGKVNGAGDYVQCFPNGMKSAGSVHDTLTASKAVVNIGSVDLGNLAFTKLSSGWFSTSLLTPDSGMSVIPNIICNKYKTITPSQAYSGSAGSGVSSGSPALYSTCVFVRDNNHESTPTQQDNWLSGVYINYELATPITYTDLIYRDNGIDRPLSDVLFNIEVNNWSIEEQLLTPYDENGNLTAVPAKISTQYGMDAVEEIDTIKHTYVSAYSEQNFSDSQKAQARRNIGAVEEDGSYPNMSVGIAKNLAGENAVEAEYTYRPSNGTIGTNTGIANVTAIKGKTLKWNQMCPNNITTGNGYTRTSTSITITDNTVTNFNNASCNIGVTTITNHKYYVKTVTNTPYLRLINYYIGSAGARDATDGIVFTESFGYIMSLGFAPGIENGTYPLQIIFFDLTDLFGAGNEPSTVAEFEALYPLDYYDYTATPILINNAASGIVTTGFNQWDEEWENGVISSADGTNGVNNNRIRSKNYIPCFPNTTYYVKVPIGAIGFRFYDANKNYLVGTPIDDKANTTIITPANAHYMRFCTTLNNYGNTYKNDICINLSDPAKNGTYEPYEKHTFYFDKVLQGEGSLATIKGKLNGEGESVVVFPDGMKSAGSVYDEIKGNVAIKRIGVVDLGDLSWDYITTGTGTGSGAYPYFKSILSDGIVSFAAILCSKYSTVVVNSTVWGTGIDKVISSGSYTSNFAINIRDTSYTDKDTFKTAMSGVILYYELATPETYILDQTVTGGYQVNALGTEKRLPEDTASAVNAPVSYSVIYPIDAVGTITKLPINYISEKSLTNFTTELASKLGTFLNATIGITATYNQTTQEYDYSITINANE